MEARLFQLGPNAEEIVDLAVEYDGVALVLRNHRLVTLRRKVQEGRSRGPEESRGPAFFRAEWMGRAVVRH